MYKHYYINTNAQLTGEHEVHEDGCYWLSLVVNKKYLGLHENCQEAVQQARWLGYKPDGCYYCCNPCHKR